MGNLEKLFEAVKKSDLEEVARSLKGDADLVHQRDDSGATLLHYATFYGHREVARLLIEHGADVNSADAEFGATPAGWAIEYLREFGGYLAIELDDLAFAIEQGNVQWVARILNRFPNLRDANDLGGKPFREHARNCESQEVRELFDGNQP